MHTNPPFLGQSCRSGAVWTRGIPHLRQDLEVLGLDAHVNDLAAPAHADGVLPFNVRASVGEARSLDLFVRKRVQRVPGDRLGWRRRKQGEPCEDCQRSGRRLFEAVRRRGHLHRGGRCARGGRACHSGSVEGGGGGEGISRGAERRDCDGDHSELHDGESRGTSITTAREWWWQQQTVTD